MSAQSALNMIADMSSFPTCGRVSIAVHCARDGPIARGVKEGGWGIVVMGGGGGGGGGY